MTDEIDQNVMAAIAHLAPGPFEHTPVPSQYGLFIIRPYTRPSVMAVATSAADMTIQTKGGNRTQPARKKTAQAVAPMIVVARLRSCVESDPSNWSRVFWLYR